MFFWTQAFVIGFNQMVLASCFGIWYWSKSKERCIMFKGIKDTFVYHLGSVAFGALLIAICKLLRTIIQIIERRLKSVADRAGTIGCCLNCFICFISCCCKCCFLCLEHFLKFMNRNAYIMVGIYGSTFCKSARDALALLAANPLRAIVLDRITDFALFLGRFLITMGIGVLAFNFFAKNFYIDPYFQPYFAPDLHYYWLPLAVTIVMSYFVSKVFFSVFEMAVDTIFLCAMKDLDEHDGSPENPYYMSKRLHSILKKKFHLDEDSTLVDKKAKASEAKNESKI
jgi:choline transporter-like protein 2/4/5